MRTLVHIWSHTKPRKVRIWLKGHNAGTTSSSMRYWYIQYVLYSQHKVTRVFFYLPRTSLCTYLYSLLWSSRTVRRWRTCWWSAPSGGMTPYHNGLPVANKDIPPDGELLKSYGDSWFENRNERIFGLTPLEDDDPKSQAITATIGKHSRKLEFIRVKNETQPWFLYAKLFLGGIANFECIASILFASGSCCEKSNAVFAWSQCDSDSQRTSSYRVDAFFNNIVHKESTFPFAGRGAFATHDL